MAKQKEKKPLDKKGWVQTFELIGKACGILSPPSEFGYMYIII